MGPAGRRPPLARLSLTSRRPLSLSPPPQVSLLMSMVPGKFMGIHYQHNRIK